MEYICKRLSANDIGMVMEMNRNFREGFVCYDAAVTFLNHENNWLFAAVMDGVIVGFAYGYEQNRIDKEKNMLYVHEVGVMEQYRRHGIGYAMMRELLQECRIRGICKCFLSTYQNNIAANALYRKLGGAVSAESQGQDTVYYFVTGG